MFVLFCLFVGFYSPKHSPFVPRRSAVEMREKCDNTDAKEKEAIPIPFYNPYFNQQPYAFGAYGGASAAPSSSAPQSNAQAGMILGRMVTSREEAVAIPADFQGNPIVMPDFPHGKIYVKFFDMNTGTASVVEFIAPQPEKKPAPQYATVDDLAQLREEIAELRRSHETEKEANA